jgi:hypothetical protein
MVVGFTTTYATQALVSFKKYMPPALPYTKEEEGAYIFFE